MSKLNVETEIVNEAREKGTGTAKPEVLERICAGERIVLNWHPNEPKVYLKKYFNISGAKDEPRHIKAIKFPVTRDGQWFHTWEDLRAHLLANAGYTKIG